ncbi:hypothetical protein EAH77_22480 [Ewingella americana]|uniref:Uncharacterized protein n=1 Tax=Ewingella americana TaxID=41202 RepID=A0A502G5G3_9GAMM|nr:hypothetical protein EAH77_22480 [Ewingella americana]
MQSDGAAAPPFLSVLFRGLVSCFPVVLFLSGLSLFFFVQLLCMIFSVRILSDILLAISPRINHPQGLAPFGSRPAAGRRARLR